MKKETEHKKIFLASSCELEADRRDFEIFIARKNKIWRDKGVYFELVIWEDFLDNMSQTRLQDQYNKAIKDCDIFVMLFATKVGKYTKEEFKTAFGKFKKTNKPFIYTYFKDNQVDNQTHWKELRSLEKFQKKLAKLGHFYTPYKSIEGLREHFGIQLDKLAANGFIEMPKPSKEENYNIVNNYINNTGDSKIYQGIKNSTITDNSTTQINKGSVGRDMIGGDIKIYNIDNIDKGDFS